MGRRDGDDASSTRTGVQYVHEASARGCVPGQGAQLDSASVLEVYGKWQPPSEELAKQQYHADHIQHQAFDVRSAKVSDFKEFGAGHMLYFVFLKYMAFLSCALAICPGLPVLIIYSSGGFLSDASDFEATSLGNFGPISTNNSTATLDLSLPSTNNGADAELVMLQYLQAAGSGPSVSMSGLHADKRGALVACSVLNLVGIVGYFIATLVLIQRTKRIAKEVAGNVTSLPAYTVAVAGLPEDTEPGELQAYFEQYGDVSQVECARMFTTLWGMVQDRKKVLDELDVALAVLQRAAELAPEVDEGLEVEVLNLQYDLSLLTEAIRARQLTRDAACVVEAYVTFKENLGRNTALAAQPHNLVQRLKYPPEKRFRGQHLLDVKEAPEVTDIMFENLEYNVVEVVTVRCLTWFIKITALVVGFVLISIAPSIKRNAGGATSASFVAECDANCAWKDSKGSLYLNDTMRTVYQDCYDTGVYANMVSCQGATICYECFCKTALSRSMYEELTYCSAFKSVLLQATGAQALTVVSIVAVNAAVTFGIRGLTLLELHRTRSQRNMGAMGALFLAHFINSGISILIANAYMPRVQSYLSDGWKKVLFGGVYPDTTPNWYREVGKSVLLSQLVGIPVRLLLIYVDFVVVYVAKALRHKALTQHQLDAAYEGHEFKLAPRTGEHLAVVFVCLTFAGGMPLLWFILALSFTCHFWLEKYEILKIAKYPNSMSASLATTAASILPFGALVNLIGGAWMISVVGTGASSIMPDGSWTYSILAALCSAMRKVWAATNELSPAQMAARLASLATAHLLYGLVALGLTTFVFFTLQSWIALYYAARKWVSRQVLPDNASTHTTQDTAGRAQDPSREPASETSEGSKDPAGTGASAEGGVGHLAMMSVPEFPLAVRSQLLVGPTSYDVRVNPNYRHAFERLDEQQVASKLMAKVEAQEAEQQGRMARNLREARRRRRRERARAVLQVDGSALVAHGQAAAHYERLATAQGPGQPHFTPPLVAGNQVAPWPGAADEAAGPSMMYGAMDMGAAVARKAAKASGGVRDDAQLDRIGTQVVPEAAQPTYITGGSADPANVPYDTSMLLPAHGHSNAARAHGSRLQ